MGKVLEVAVDGFKWIGNTSQFSKDFIENYNEDSDEGYFRRIDVHFPEKLQDFHNDLLFLPEKMKIEKVEKLIANLHKKENIPYT